MKRTLLSSSLSLLLLGGAIWWMSTNVVWLGDDLDYKYKMTGEIWQSWGKIKTVKSFFESQWIHYTYVNGRYVSHALVQLFNACLGQPVFALCNAFVYLLFALLLAKAGGVSIKNNPGGVISAICLSVLCFITKMMPTCQIGYIWGMTANIGWLMAFFSRKKSSWLMTAIMMITGIIVGNWQESVSIGVCGGLGIWWIAHIANFYKTHSSCFEWRRSWMLLGYVAGTATNCLAPSTLGRVSDITMPLPDQLLIASYSFPAIILLIITVIIVRRKNGYPQLLSFFSNEGRIPDGVLICGMLVLIAFNIAIGIYSNRQLFGANLFAAILLLRILPHHRFNRVINALAVLGVLGFWTLMVYGIREVSRQYDDILTFHAESGDGIVFYDRTRVMPLGFPLRAKYYEDILGQFDNDLHHSLMKDIKHSRRGKTLKLKPTIPMMNKESVGRYAPGHFTVTLKEPPKGEAPREIIVYGHYPFSFMKAEPRRIEVTRYLNRSKSHATAVIIPEFPFFVADSIQIIPSPTYNL